MPDLVSLNPILLSLVFLIIAGIIAVTGTQLAKIAEDIAIETGWGQALVGTLFIGISTSLSGTVLSFYSAAQSYPSLAISNSIGGIAAQTVFLAIADISYRNINLEHAAASLENLALGALLLILLPIPLLAMSGPEWTFLGIHPGSIVLISTYLIGLKIVGATKSDPMWKPKFTNETQIEKKIIGKNIGIKKKHTDQIFYFGNCPWRFWSGSG